MTYERLIETISEIVENEAIEIQGLSLVYELDEDNHKRMNEHLFYKANSKYDKFKPTDEFEVELGGIVIKFIKKPENSEE